MGSITDIRLLRCMDGVHYAASILKQSYESLYPACCRIPVDPSSFPLALSLSWTVIDATRRIRDIAYAVPGLGRKRREVVEFDSSTTVVEAFRNYIQHLRQELSKRQYDPFPVWGSLSWVNPSNLDECLTAVSGTQLPGVAHTSGVLDQVATAWTSKVSLSLGSSTAAIDAIYKSAAAFAAWLEQWIVTNASFTVERRTELPILSAKIVRGEA
jgi:hypothetical protein